MKIISLYEMIAFRDVNALGFDNVSLRGGSWKVKIFSFLETKIEGFNEMMRNNCTSALR